MTRYVVLIFGTRGAWTITVPDLPGCTCTSAGRTINEALKNATETVRLWISDAGIATQSRAFADVVKDEKVKEALARGAKLAMVVVAS
jgi:predicted RNase H-like HicB family nuclease